MYLLILDPRTLILDPDFPGNQNLQCQKWQKAPEVNGLRLFKLKTEGQTK